MHIYKILMKEFQFLKRVYGFHISDKQTRGSYYYITFTNFNIEIKVLYDLQEEDPLTILIYDADSLGTIYDVIKYKKEICCCQKSPNDKIHYASQWLYNAISNRKIIV